jgi:hypothetical protein
MIEQIEECRNLQRNLMNNVEDNGENCRPVNLIEREGYGWQESRRENGMNMVKPPIRIKSMLFAFHESPSRFVLFVQGVYHGFTELMYDVRFALICADNWIIEL